MNQNYMAATEMRKEVDAKVNATKPIFVKRASFKLYEETIASQLLELKTDSRNHMFIIEGVRKQNNQLDETCRRKTDFMDFKELHDTV